MLRFSLPIIAFFLSLHAQATPPELQRIVSQAEQLSRRGTVPVVIADLDETLIDSTPRRHKALKEAVASECGAMVTGLCAIQLGINIQDIYALPNRYDLNDLFDRVGFPPFTSPQSTIDKTLEIYLSGRLIEEDQPIPGAVELVQALRDAHAQIYFVSSRSKELQLAGTLANLRQIGFLPEGEDEKVILRPKGMSSIDFKRSSFSRIKEWTESRNGRVTMVMENEPENMNSMTEIFPEAYAVFVDGAFIKNEPLRGKLLHVKSFR